MIGVVGSKAVLCAAVVALTLAPSVSFSAAIKATPGKDGRVFITITGEIIEGDSDTFIAAVKVANAAGKLVANVRLNSDGGNLLEGVKLAEAVRTGKIATNVGKTSVCASACFLVFAAGADKNASYGAQIGVHGASDRDGQETVRSGAATVSMARIAKELGVPPAIIGRMVVTPPDQMVWLSPQELQSMGVTMSGKPTQMQPPALDAPVAQQIPGPPTSLSPQLPDARASNKQPTWDEFINKVVSLSASQNNGKADFVRFCQPEFKTCTIAVTYGLKSGKTGFAKVVEDMNGKQIRREICEMNNFKDVRDCVDWDTGATHRDMKNPKGDWIQID